MGTKLLMREPSSLTLVRFNVLPLSATWSYWLPAEVPPSSMTKCAVPVVPTEPRERDPFTVSFPTLLKPEPPESPGERMPPVESLLIVKAPTEELTLFPLATVAPPDTVVALLPEIEPETSSLPAATLVDPA